METIENILVKILAIFLWYLVLTFVNWDFDIANWHWTSRIFGAFITIYCLIKSDK